MSNWQQKFKGEIWVVDQQAKDNGQVFELARRSPGVRVMIVNDQGHILLNREKRYELSGEFDLRVPGGKVFDDIDEWLAVSKDDELLLDAARKAAVSEAREESGIIIQENDLEFLAKDINGGKGEWDLYFFMVRKFQIDPNGPAFHNSEADEIEGWDWFSKEQALKQALDYKHGMSESRAARYVASWANQNS